MNMCMTTVDAVWDHCPEGSHKNQTRVKRFGKAAARQTRVLENVSIPKEKIGRHS